jgi:riboflavin synthase
MFTGIIETIGTVTSLNKHQANLEIEIKCAFANELKVDQSVAHNGVCLTVTQVCENEKTYRVTAIEETLKRSNLGNLGPGDFINLERCMHLNARLDGHIVQGHVDATATCTKIIDLNGSWQFYFENDGTHKNLIVEKGSITVNGVSLTVVDAGDYSFSVAIIPYTKEHTNFKTLKQGDKVNIEFDIIGKYVARLMHK